MTLSLSFRELSRELKIGLSSSVSIIFVIFSGQLSSHNCMYCIPEIRTIMTFFLSLLDTFFEFTLFTYENIDFTKYNYLLSFTRAGKVFFRSRSSSFRSTAISFCCERDISISFRRRAISRKIFRVSGYFRVST